MVKDLGVIAFAKVKSLEKRLKVIEDYIIEQRKTPAQEVRDYVGAIR